jgi:hypothetical protein
VSVSPPPNVVDRTRTAVIETGNALRDGVEAGIEAANQQLYQGNEQVIETARNAGQELSNKFQGWAGTAAQQAGVAAPGPPPSTINRQQVSNPFINPTPATAPIPRTRAGVAPPPWGVLEAASDEPPITMAAREPATGAPPVSTGERTPVQIEGGWTSVHSSVAPPRLAPPSSGVSSAANVPLLSPVANAATRPPVARPGGPNFPATITANEPAERSVLTDPQQSQQPLQQLQSPPATTSVGSWDFGWENKVATQPGQPATIGSRYGTTAITTPEASQARDVASQQPTASQPAAALSATGTQSPANQTAARQPGFQPETTFGNGAFDKKGWPTLATPQAGTVTPPNATTSGAADAGNAVSQPFSGSIAAVGTPPNAASVATGQTVTGPQVGPAPTLPASNAEELPWVPLLAASLGLAGSIGANLFLGWSYIDARQKYRTLVQKTANKFRRTLAA